MAWWRGEGAEGELTIEGSELHGRPGSVSAIVLPGYGLTGFQVTGVIIPSDGCWEVIGRSGDAELRFITRLVITE